MISLIGLYVSVLSGRRSMESIKGDIRDVGIMVDDALLDRMGESSFTLVMMGETSIIRPFLSD